jgi:signal transduction histidine kinase
LDPPLRKVLDVAREVLTALDLDVVLDRVLVAARELTGARYAALGIVDRSRGELERFLTSGVTEETRRTIGTLPRGRGVLGELIEHPAPLRLADVNAHPRSYGFPPGHPPMRSFLGVPVEVDGAPYGNLYLTEKAGGQPFTAEDEEALVMLADLAAIAIDHARRYGGQAARRAELERTVDALDATLQIARALGGETDLDRILELVAKRGRALVSARTLIIEQLRDGEMVVAAGAGELPRDLIGRRVDPRDSVASAAMRTLRTLRLEDEPNRARFERHGLGRLGFHAEAGLVVPLMFRGEAYGALIAVDRLAGGGAFGADDERLLEAFSSSAATAMATARSMAEERARQRLAAAEEERGRWARELHDETLQGLAALRLGLASPLQSGRTEAMADVVRQAVSQLEDEIAKLRALIAELRPAALDELGVRAAIEALVERTRSAGIDIDAHIDLAFDGGRSRERHDPELEIALYRIVQEALTNARTHGEASRAVVEVVEEAASVRISVRDDGRGFDPSGRSDGFGLLGMRERAELLGGALDVSSAPGQGTSITATLPSRRRPGAGDEASPAGGSRSAGR